MAAAIRQRRGGVRRPEEPGNHRDPPGVCEGVASGIAGIAGQAPTEQMVTASPDGSDRDRLVSDLFDLHYAGLCRLACLLLGDQAAAEEAVQEAFVRTYSGWWRVRHPERAQWYLRAAVVNQCRSRSRRRASEDRGNRSVWTDQGSRDDGHHDPDEALAVLAAVRALPPRQRAAVVLRYYEDLSEADVASVLGCTVGTVKSQLSKARAALARQLQDVRSGG